MSAVLQRTGFVVLIMKSDYRKFLGTLVTSRASRVKTYFHNPTA
jgi:hypothetical protein